MIITRAPFRISLGGGGTDLPFYAQEKGGFLITAAINQYVYVSIHRRQLDKLIWLSYSERETRHEVEAISHQLIREALKLVGGAPAVEIHSLTELSERTGLGGSSTFLTALLHALYTYQGSVVSKNKLAEDAVAIERTILKHDGGIQDQYISAHGGICSITNRSLTDVTVEPLSLKPDVLEYLSLNLLLFYTGVQRLSAPVVKAQTDENQQKDIVHFYDQIKDIGRLAKQRLLEGDLDNFGRTFHDHWMLKRRFTKKMSNDNFDSIYEKALRCGALGGKIVGAGGGGFFLFYVPGNHERFSEQMKQLGLTQVRFAFDFDGTTTVLNTEK